MKNRLFAIQGWKREFKGKPVDGNESIVVRTKTSLFQFQFVTFQPSNITLHPCNRTEFFTRFSLDPLFAGRSVW
mgnify:CR=1